MTDDVTRLPALFSYWHSYGDYDGVATWKDAMTVGHLNTAPNEGTWASIVSDAPAAAIGHSTSKSGYAFEVGACADLVLFPGARRLSELLSRPAQPDRVVLRRGAVQNSTLPHYSEIDDLVATRTVLSVRAQPVQRGATAQA